jgi:hypothetical protein
VQSIAVSGKTLRSNAVGVKIFQSDVFDDAVAHMDSVSEPRAEKEMETNSRCLELIEESNVPIRRLVNGSILIEINQRTHKRRLHLALSLFLPVSI